MINNFPSNNLFSKIDSIKTDGVLDKDEIAKAEKMGFNLFELKEGMNEDAFIGACDDCALDVLGDDEKQKELNEKVNDIEVNYVLETMSKEDRDKYNSAMANKDNVDKVRETLFYFMDNFDNDEVAPIITKLGNIDTQFMEQASALVKTMPPTEQNLFNDILGGEWTKENIDKAQKSIQKYPNSNTGVQYLKSYLSEVAKNFE